jgi:hypothetical protein
MPSMAAAPSFRRLGSSSSCMFSSSYRHTIILLTHIDSKGRLGARFKSRWPRTRCAPP